MSAARAREEAAMRPMNRRYRYRTPVLIGSWRSSREQAVEDAIKAKQAAREPGGETEIKWIVPGTIEEVEA